ncbi:MAG: TetR/AcrR family transcriptional regulator [Acidobacteria bacterium]|nr:TetR/AcrR family transcriptional regulator [Acidobacteriota bacterium]
MSPRPAPDLKLRGEQITQTARAIAESDGWEAVTMRRIASDIGVTQPVLYSAFAGGRQAIIDAVAVSGFAAIADALEAVAPDLKTRMRTYLAFANSQPRLYEAMFAMQTELHFGADHTPEPLKRAFAAIQETIPGRDVIKAEVVWATIHGLATLESSGRLPQPQAEARLTYAHRVLAGQG